MEKTLVVLAAGMGSRFGGLKQIEPMGPNGEFIIDYSVYDAVEAGFTKIVFVIKEELFDIFKETVGKRVEDHVKVEYVFQDVKDIPEGMHFDREKPWGTAHAILCAKKVVNENFAMINADDFYGKDAFKRASEFLDEANDSYLGLVGYKAVNTLTENGSVKRGVCQVSDDNKLITIEESSIIRNGDVIQCTSLEDGHEFSVALDTLVSMNMLLFTPNIFNILEKGFKEFLENIKDEKKDEYLIPSVIKEKINSGEITVEVLRTTSVWYGVTYKEDKDSVKNAIIRMIKDGEYKNNLWR